MAGLHKQFHVRAPILPFCKAFRAAVVAGRIDAPTTTGKSGLKVMKFS
jgi:hypothetical protein